MYDEARVAKPAIAAPTNQPSEGGQIVFLNRLDLYHTSPDPGAPLVQIKELKKAI